MLKIRLPKSDMGLYRALRTFVAQLKNAVTASIETASSSQLLESMSNLHNFEGMLFEMQEDGRVRADEHRRDAWMSPSALANESPWERDARHEIDVILSKTHFDKVAHRATILDKDNRAKSYGSLDAFADFLSNQYADEYDDNTPVGSPPISEAEALVAVHRILSSPHWLEKIKSVNWVLRPESAAGQAQA